MKMYELWFKVTRNSFQRLVTMSTAPTNLQPHENSFEDPDKCSDPPPPRHSPPPPPPPPHSPPAQPEQRKLAYKSEK